MEKENVLAQKNLNNDGARPIVPEKTVADYKTRERHKWNLSMAKNNSAVLLSSVYAKFSPNEINLGSLEVETKAIIKKLYRAYNEIDEEFKDEIN